FDLRAVPGCPDIRADAEGQIWSVKDQVVKRRKLSKARNGYLVIHVSNPSRTEYVHQLIWWAFHGVPVGKLDVCHNDGDRTNNRLSNLRVDTRAGNLADRHRHGTMNNGERCGSALLREFQVREIRTLCRNGHSQTEVAALYGVSRSAVQAVVCGYNWKHVK